MLRMFKGRWAGAVEFCERCGSVCDAACRRNALRDRALDRRLSAGPRFL